MIVLDASALLAILFGEPEAERLADLLAESDVFLPASVLVEASIVALHRGMESKLRKLFDALSPEIAALNEWIAAAAIAAYKTYGKGRHKANLNFGDCLAYATAKYSGLPLIFKGNDFARTDVLRLAGRKH